MVPCYLDEIYSLGEQGHVIAALIRRFQEVKQVGTDSLSRQEASRWRSDFLMPVYELGQVYLLALQTFKRGFPSAQAIISSAIA
ncbi:MAG TPA: hypothetical protein DDY43_11110 [Synechococcales bacterium UBA10510]|nr:hypothetical protein [Synechococcales bacterium UBA10510]